MKDIKWKESMGNIPRKRCATPRHQRGVALVITLAILAMLLVLMVAFGTLSRTELVASAQYRDYTHSKVLAHQALNRALAEIAQRYSADSTLLNSGISSIYSSIDTNNNTYATLLTTAIKSNYVTDIERAVTNAATSSVYAQAGADNVVDYATFPGDLNSKAQWIGFKDTNNILIGRIAYVVTSGNLNINAIGSLATNAAVPSITMNARNAGYSVAELNLPAALMAVNSSVWTYANATNDAETILNYRYNNTGSGYWPGSSSAPSVPSALTDGLDNDGDGVIDNASDDGGTGPGSLPQLFLTNSDGTARNMIQPVGDDRVFQDLKQLHNGAISNSAASQSRFRTNYNAIQKWFTLQSAVPVSSNLFNLNDTNTYPNDTHNSQSNFFVALTNHFAKNNLFTNFSAAELATTFPYTNDASINTSIFQTKVAANIVTHFSTNPHPFNPTIAGQWYTPEVPVPHINKIAIDIYLKMRKEQTTNAGGNPITNIIRQIRYRHMIEIWNPYTNAFDAALYPDGVKLRWVSPSANITDVTIQGWGNYFLGDIGTGSDSFADILTLAPAGFTSAIPFNQITNENRFYTYISSVRDWPVEITNGPLVGASYAPATYGDVFLCNFLIGNRFAIVDGSLAIDKILDYVYFSSNGVDFRTNSFFRGFKQTNLMPLTAPTNETRYLTNRIVFQFNDIRTKDIKMTCHAILPLNAALANPWLTNVVNSNSIFKPELGEDKSFSVAGVPQGIAPQTFYVKQQRLLNSIADLGRVHSGLPWKTIDLKPGGTNIDILNYFTVVPNTGSKTYVHGRVSLNSATNATPIWAALFAGMPITLDSGATTNLDILPSGELNPAFPQSKKLGELIGANAGTYTNLAKAASINAFSNLYVADNAVFPSANFNMKSDADQEYMLRHVVNLVGGANQGNFFTIMALGQALGGPPVNTNRLVKAETLIMAMVQAETNSSGKLDLKPVYIRYNPDIELK